MFGFAPYAIKGFDSFEKLVSSWGARAIYQWDQSQKCYTIDLLPDRQTWFKENQESKQEFMDWINRRALPWLRKELKEKCILPTESVRINLKEYKYELVANPNKSAGYLYISCVEHEVIPVGTVPNKATGKEENVVSVNNVRMVVDKEFKIGTKGKVNVNGIGSGTVLGFFEENYDDMKLVCLRVALDNPPKWWIEQMTYYEAKKLGKEGRLPVDSFGDVKDKSPEYKHWVSKWQPDLCICWANDFVPSEQ